MDKNIIKKCNICHTNVGGGYNSLLKELIGLGDYTQEICQCKNCGFIFVSKDFSQI